MKLNNKKSLSIITKDMSDKDRAFYLKEKVIIITKSIDLPGFVTNDILDTLKVSNKTKAKKILKSIGELCGIFKEYKSIGDTSINALFSRNNLYESVSKSTDMLGMAYVIININSILRDAFKIEEHLDNKLDRNIKVTHEFISVLYKQNECLMLIKITIKEMTNIDNSVYSLSNFEVIKKRDGHPQMFEVFQALETGHPSYTISFAQLIKHVNSPDILRYIPNELLDNKQIKVKEKALIEYKRIKEIQSKKNS